MPARAVLPQTQMQVQVEAEAEAEAEADTPRGPPPAPPANSQAAGQAAQQQQRGSPQQAQRQGSRPQQQQYPSQVGSVGCWLGVDIGVLAKVFNLVASAYDTYVCAWWSLSSTSLVNKTENSVHLEQRENWTKIDRRGYCVRFSLASKSCMASVYLRGSRGFGVRLYVNEKKGYINGWVHQLLYVVEGFAAHLDVCADLRCST